MARRGPDSRPSTRSRQALRGNDCKRQAATGPSNQVTAGCSDGVLISNVQPGLGAACAALKGGATFKTGSPAILQPLWAPPSDDKIFFMRRRMEALALLASLGCVSLSGLAAVIEGSGALGCCGLGACCQQKSCPTKSRSDEMASHCPMMAHAKQSSAPANCLCLGSSPAPSWFAAGHFDFRFDFPRSGSNLMPPSSFSSDPWAAPPVLKGFSRQLDQPPKTRL
jgi:hypothetical protein